MCAHTCGACVRPRGCWEEWWDVTLCFPACWFWMWPISEAESNSEGCRGGGPLAFTMRDFSQALRQGGVEKCVCACMQAYTTLNIMTNKRTFQSFMAALPLSKSRERNAESEHFSLRSQKKKDILMIHLVRRKKNILSKVSSNQKTKEIFFEASTVVKIFPSSWDVVLGFRKR